MAVDARAERYQKAGTDVARTYAEWIYWIVQPLSQGFGRTGFTSFFGVPSMGRSEYESLGGELKKLYEAAGGAPIVERHQVTVAGTSRPVYFVGPRATLGAHARDMELWLGTGGETKMPCWFAEFFHTSESEQIEMIPEVWRRPIAWWSMKYGDGFMFALDRDVAANLLNAIELEASTRGSHELGWWV